MKTETGRAFIVLDREALKKNVSLLSEKALEGCQLMPAVKANAYGHGAVPVARELNRLGIRSFCVAEVMEGVELRKKHVRGDILVLGYTHPSQFGLLKKYRLTQTVIDREYAGLLNRCQGRAFGLLRAKIKVHVKIDTGMHRLGEDASHVEQIASIWKLPGLKVTGIYTHLCAADSERAEDTAYTGQQVERFDVLVEALTRRGITCPPGHVQSSYGLLNEAVLSCFREEREGKSCPKYEYARPGIALYGLFERKQDRILCKPESRPVPVLSLYARIETVKEIKAGESAGYGRAYTASRNGRIAVLSIGYADGIPRSLGAGDAYVLIGGKKAPVIGRICMDQMLVEVTDIKEAVQGGIAVLIGSSGDESGKIHQITAEDMAEWAGTITNELVSRLGSRLTRVMTSRRGYPGRDTEKVKNGVCFPSAMRGETGRIHS